MITTSRVSSFFDREMTGVFEQLLQQSVRRTSRPTFQILLGGGDRQRRVLDIKSLMSRNAVRLSEPGYMFGESGKTGE